MSDYDGERFSDLERKVYTLQSDRDSLAKLVITLVDHIHNQQGADFKALREARAVAEEMLLPYRD
jgi:hypothetical protein